MKTLTTVAVLFFSSLSLSAYAQLQGAVSFDKSVSDEKKQVVPVVETADVQKKDDQKKEQSEKSFDEQAYLKERLKKAEVFDNPRYTKKVYGSLQGTQLGIEKEQDAVMKEKTFGTPEEKIAFEQELKDKALVRFKDFEGDKKTINNQINENPTEKALEMVNNTTYIDVKKLSPEDSKAIRDQVEADFIAREGISLEEYMRLSQQQLLENNGTIVPAGNLSDKTRIAKSSPIEVKKIDEKTAVIQPRHTSKKAKRK